MATPQQDILDKLNVLDLRQLARDTIIATAYEIVTLTESQVYDGKDKTGATITPKYGSTYYSKKKALQNPSPGYGNRDWYASGNLYKNIGVSVTDDEYIIDAPSVSYLPKLIEQSGDNILLLSDQNKAKYVNETLKPALTQAIQEKTGFIFD